MEDEAKRAAIHQKQLVTKSRAVSAVCFLKEQFNALFTLLSEAQRIFGHCLDFFCCCDCCNRNKVLWLWFFKLFEASQYFKACPCSYLCKIASVLSGTSFFDFILSNFTFDNLFAASGPLTCNFLFFARLACPLPYALPLSNYQTTKVPAACGSNPASFWNGLRFCQNGCLVSKSLFILPGTFLALANFSQVMHLNSVDTSVAKRHAAFVIVSADSFFFLICKSCVSSAVIGSYSTQENDVFFSPY